MKRRKPHGGDEDEDEEADSPLPAISADSEEEEPTSDDNDEPGMPKKPTKPAGKQAQKGSTGVARNATRPMSAASSRRGSARHSASVTISTLPLVKKRLSGSTSTVSGQFKMPVPNYRPPAGKVVATLGLRKPYANVPGIQQLLGSITTHITNPEAGTPSNQAVPAAPFLIYDPAQDEDQARAATLKAVYVESVLAGKLRPHQREGVAFMFNCLAGLKTGGFTGAILMDGMGLGKTFQSICTLWTLCTTGTSGQPTCRRPLILCPSSLVMNWGNELKRWLGQDKVDPLVLDDTRGAVVKDALERAWSSLRGLAALAGGAGKQQVLVMSYTTLRMHKEAVYRKGIDLIVCDEAHCLKNGDSQITQAVAGIPATRRLLLSGTPVQNDLSEFYTLFHVAVPGLLGAAAQFRKTFELPILRGQDADATERDVSVGLERSQQLLAVCGPYMLRRTCGVMAQYLPPKVEQVVFCKMSSLQIKLYHHFHSSQPVQALLRGGRAAAAREMAAAQQVAAGQPGGSNTAAAADAAAAGGADGSSDGHGGGGGGGGGGGQASGAAAAVAGGGGGGKKSKASGSAASGRGRQSGAAVGGGGGGGGVPRQPELSVLAAITAVKKLCCHPDLIYDMMKPPAAPGANRLLLTRALPAGATSGGGGGAAAAGRPSGTSCTTTTAAAQPTPAPPAAGAAGGGGAGRGRVSGGVTGGAEDASAVITGFENCLPVFTDPQVYPEYVPGRCDPMHSGKVQVLVQLLKSIRTHEPTDKVVLVSNYTEALDLLTKLFTLQQWPTLRLDGSLSVKSRQPLVDSFNDPAHPSFILLLSSKAGGVGLNIIGANRLILFDPDWNPANDLQAMARVWREGQKKQVWIYRLLTTGSLEEKVYQRQLMKQGLSKSVVDEGGGNQSRQFSAEELRALFKVNPGVVCDTHDAIKCSCDGSLRTMTAKATAAQAKAAEQQAERKEAADEGHDKAPVEAGVMDWAHLTDVENSPDHVWKHVPPFVRQRYVTYLFSDHITNPPTTASLPGGGPGAGKAGAADEEQEEEEQGSPGTVGRQGASSYPDSDDE